MTTKVERIFQFELIVLGEKLTIKYEQTYKEGSMPYNSDQPYKILSITTVHPLTNILFLMAPEYGATETIAKVIKERYAFDWAGASPLPVNENNKLNRLFKQAIPV